jgi:hypothetical protein
LRLVTDNSPAADSSPFDDLDALRAETEMPSVATRRLRSTETFARIPHGHAYKLAFAGLTGSAWMVLIVLDHLILKGRGKNPVRLTHRALKAAGLSRFAVKRALRQLERAGVIAVEQRPGQAPLVRHLWFPAG